MYHCLDYVAESRHADVGPFVAFAMVLENRLKYSILETGESAQVNTCACR